MLHILQLMHIYIVLALYRNHVIKNGISSSAPQQDLALSYTQTI